MSSRPISSQPAPAALAHLSNVPLDLFTREGQPLEVRVAWWPVTLFFVPDARHAEWRESDANECGPRASYSSCWREPPWTAEAFRVVMVARRELGGEVVAVHPLANPSPCVRGGSKPGSPVRP